MQFQHVYRSHRKFGKLRNTSAASITLALDEAVRSVKVQPGHTVAAAGFGAGLTWGSMIVRWGEEKKSNSQIVKRW